jgi:hypothetical protein
MDINEMYLGDGVYASFDGYQIWLSTERDGRSHKIAIEPEVLHAINAYEKHIRDKKRSFI